MCSNLFLNYFKRINLFSLNFRIDSTDSLNQIRTEQNKKMTKRWKRQKRSPHLLRGKIKELKIRYFTELKKRKLFVL